MSPHTIEPAKTSRSSCRGCGQRIAQGELRLGVAHAQENGGHSYQWWHLACAFPDRVLELEQALAATTLPVPDRAALDARVAAAVAARPPLPLPRAAGGPGLDTYHCLACGSWSFPDTLRVLVPTTIQVAGRTLPREAPIHPGCARGYLPDPGLLQTILRNSPGLTPEHEQWLRDDLK